MNSSQLIDKVVQGQESQEVLKVFYEDSLSKVNSVAIKIQRDLQRKFKTNEVKRFLVEINRQLSKVSEPTVKDLLSLIRRASSIIGAVYLAPAIVVPIRNSSLSALDISKLLSIISSNFDIKSSQLT